MNILVLKRFNNYFNRKVKLYSELSDYESASQSYRNIPNINFNPNDGVRTELILGVGLVDGFFDFEKTNTADYLVCYTTVEESGVSTNTIESRWFITEVIRTRAGQYRVMLKRDVIADYFNTIKSAPIFLEKATIRDVQNPLLYTSENFPVNQVKTSETLIKDRSGIAWIVGYVSSKLSTESKDIPVTTIHLNNSGAASGSFVYTVSYGYAKIYVTYGGTSIYSGQSGFTATLNQVSGVLTYSINNSAWANQTVTMRVIYTEIGDVASNTYKTSIPGDETRNHLADAPYDMFCIPFGEIHLRTANITTVKQAALEIAFEFAKDLGKDAIYDIQLLPYCPKQDMLLTGEVAEPLGTVGYDYNYIYDNSNNIKSIMLWCKKSTDSFIAQADDEIKVPRPLETTVNAGSLEGTDARISRTSSLNTNASIRIQNDIFKTRVLTGNVSFTATNGTYSDTISNVSDYDQSTDTGVVVISYSGTNFPVGSQSNITFNLSYSYQNYENPLYLDYKISNECDVYRLTSPNFSGQFEWSIAKSAGDATIYDVDFTYKPHQPYIHLSPIFTKLYGQDFNDVRGLICGGDFSMPIITDAWTEYQVHNKTYQDVFDRQIQNMDVTHNIQGTQAAIQGGLGIATAAIGGGVSGAKIGGGYGAAAGTIVGTATSTAGMIADMELMKQAQAEERSYATDMYNYGLQNIQALPYNLTKVAAYTANNKIFPMLEYYTCTDIEKKAFKEKLKYNGMSLMIICTLNDYLDTTEERFYKGQIIRLPSIEDDSHLANEIYNEISKGVYI